MEPIFERVAAEYGHYALHPSVISQIYEQVGGPERFAPDPAAAGWERLAEGRPRNAFNT